MHETQQRGPSATMWEHNAARQGQRVGAGPLESPLPMRPMDPASLALALAFEDGPLSVPEQGPLAFLRARPGPLFAHAAAERWYCEQPFRPWADALEQAGIAPNRALEPGQAALAACLLPRQREDAQAVLARALVLLAPGALLVAAARNDEGARSREADLATLTGEVQSMSRRHCRVFWARHQPERSDADRIGDWLGHQRLRRVAETGLMSCPGLFSWNRLDPGSALLAEHLPHGFTGHAADLGAGWGYLALELLRRSPGLAQLDLYEADARALEAAAANLPADPRIRLRWHDVCRGLPQRYALIVCNPPFHQGHSAQPGLGQAFIRSAAAALDADGLALFVANRQLPYEASLRERFASVETIEARAGYKLVRARGPRR